MGLELGKTETLNGPLGLGRRLWGFRPFLEAGDKEEDLRGIESNIYTVYGYMDPKTQFCSPRFL